MNEIEHQISLEEVTVSAEQEAETQERETETEEQKSETGEQAKTEEQIEAEEEEGEDEEGEEPELPPGEKFRRSVLEWTETIVMAIIIVATVFTFLVRIITVDGGSMVPTYHDGDKVLVTNLAGAVQQGDVVIIVNELDKPIIKRVVALEGQTVDFDDAIGEVIIDGTPLLGEIFHIDNGITMLPRYSNVPVLNFPQTVPKGCVFVLGDNRGNSTDSRFASVGMVDCRNILGKVIFNLYPLSQTGVE